MAIQDRIQQKKYGSECEHAFVSLVYTAGHILQRLDDACEGHGITHTQYNVLRILRGVHPEGHPRGEIVKRLITRAPDVTRLLDRLEKQELIERTWSKENRRLSIAKITRKGLDLLKKIDPDIRRIQSDTTGRLSSSESSELARMCETMAAES
jgi:DNA-binding MarR family transcriptional regulator